jgi:TetR/AcrR family transcriptional repressor of nem operon
MSPGPQKQFDRDEVLEKAMQLFWERGYEATGMSQLLEHVGIGRQSLYDTFGDKRSLFLATLDHYFRTRGGPILAQLRAPGSPMENIQQVFRMWEKMAEDTHFCRCLIGNSAAEMAYTDTEIAERIAEYVRALEDAFCDAVTRARERGEIASVHDPRDVARSFINMIQGVALLSKVLRDPEMAKGVLRSSLRMLEAS